VRCARAWDKNIDQAMRHFDLVPQPLAEWVSGEFWADWQLWPAPLKSTVDLLCARLA
jgi:hypothetical protein